MSDAPLTLKSFFCADPARPIARELDLAAAMKAVEAAGADLPRAAMPRLAGAFESAFDEMFDVDLSGLIESSWRKLKSLDEAFKASAADPLAVSIVPLLDHTIASTPAPRIELLNGPKALAQLAFDIALTLELKGVALEIRGGRVHGLKSGDCLGQGALSFAGQTLLQRQTPAFPLPGRLRFAPAAPPAA